MFIFLKKDLFTICHFWFILKHKKEEKILYYKYLFTVNIHDISCEVI